MSRHQNSFIFKKFKVSHHRSSIKVGFDAVTLGAWTELPCDNSDEGTRILDVGCGCGIISLMLAQRFPNAEIVGIDIDLSSIEECRENFSNSGWSDRLRSEEGDFIAFAKSCISKGVKFDCIVSNPPFFAAGLESPDTPRLKARHQSILNPSILVETAKDILTEGGVISLIIPTEQVKELLEYCNSCKLSLKRITVIKDRMVSVSKRTLLELTNTLKEVEPLQEILIVRDKEGEYSPEYKELCKDFFLKF